MRKLHQQVISFLGGTYNPFISASLEDKIQDFSATP